MNTPALSLKSSASHASYTFCLGLRDSYRQNKDTVMHAAVLSQQLSYSRAANWINRQNLTGVQLQACCKCVRVQRGMCEVFEVNVNL